MVQAAAEQSASANSPLTTVLYSLLQLPTTRTLTRTLSRRCSNTTQKVCHGFVAKFASGDGELEWEQKFDDLGAAFWIKYDAHDESLYFTATTTYGGGRTSKSKGPADGKPHANCDHDTCAVTGRLSATDGTVHWLRTLQGSPRWGAFDQSGDIELAPAADGPYVYAAFDDAGETGVVSLDAGTPYAGCKAADGTVTPEYEISTSKLVTAADCPAGSTFIARTDPEAVPAAAAKTYTLCGDKEAGPACIVKYHKFTGMPIWSRDSPMVAAMVPSPDGKSLMTTGWSYASWGEARPQPAPLTPADAHAHTVHSPLRKFLPHACRTGQVR